MLGSSVAVLGGRVRDGVARLRQSRFAGNVASVGAGIAAAQIITLAFSPFLTRLYGPEAFGVLAAFTALVNIIGPVATLGYANAIVMPKDDEQACAVARLSLASAGVVAPASLLLVHVFRPQLATWTGLAGSPGFLYLIPLSLVLSAVFSVTSQAAIREGLFKSKAQAHVGSTLILNVAKLTGGLLAPSGLLLIAIAVLGPPIRTAALLGRVPRRGALRLRSWLGFDGIDRAASEHRDFALYRMPQSIINAAALGLPVIMLTALFGADSAGQYSITVLVLGAPVMLLGQSIGEVFYPKITRAIQSQTGTAQGLIRTTTIALALLGAAPFGLIAVLGDRIFPFVFGDAWVRAGEYAQWIALWMAASLASRPSVAAVPALRLQHVLLVYEIAVTVARVTALYAGARALDSDVAAIAIFSAVNVVGYLFLVALSWTKARKFDADAFA